MTEIPLSQPDITDADIEAVTAVMKSGRLSIGPRQDLFEQLVADRAQRRHGIAVSSGTAALHLVLSALGVGPGDEVITTPFSFIASANAILMVGATPRFVDICPQSLNLDPERLDNAITDKTRAVIAVEVFGNPKHMDRIEKIARSHDIALIEDACEALGGKWNNRPVGSFGRASVFGFYPNKQVTTGEGGMIVCDNENLAELCRSMRNQGRAVSRDSENAKTSNKSGSWLGHPRMGYNYRLSEIACALGVAQMERLDTMLEARRRVVGLYMRQLMDWDELILPTVEPGHEEDWSWFVFVVRLADLYGQTERDRMIDGLRRHEVGAANYFPPIHLQPFYQQRFGFKKGDFPIAESIAERTIALPFFNDMTERQVQVVCETLKVMLQREQLLKPD
jgi:perosamine synthetase